MVLLTNIAAGLLIHYDIVLMFGITTASTFSVYKSMISEKVLTAYGTVGYVAPFVGRNQPINDMLMIHITACLAGAVGIVGVLFIMYHMADIAGQ